MPLENLSISIFKLLNASPEASTVTIGLTLFMVEYLPFMITLLLVGQWLRGRDQQKQAVLSSLRELQ